MKPHATNLCRQAAYVLLAAAEACLADGERGSDAVAANLLEGASQVHFALSWMTSSFADEAMAKELFRQACELKAKGFR